MASFLDNIRKGDVMGILGNAVSGLSNEWLGLDDFRRVISHLGDGDFGAAIKSMGAGVFELGGSALMVLPGGQVAALAAKGGKLGSVGKALGLLAPLTAKEQALAKGAKTSGAARKLFKSPLIDAGAFPAAMVAKEGKSTLAKKLLAKAPLPEALGYSRGGITGSVIRGAGQASGMLPGAGIGGKVLGPVTGRALPLFARTGIDTQLMYNPPVQDVTPAPDTLEAALAQMQASDVGSGVVPEETLADVMQRIMLRGQ